MAIKNTTKTVTKITEVRVESVDNLLIASADCDATVGLMIENTTGAIINIPAADALAFAKELVQLVKDSI